MKLRNLKQFLLCVKSISYYKFADRFLAFHNNPHCGEYILKYIDVCNFESSQKDESRVQSTDSSKAYRKPSTFNLHH